MGFKRFHQCGLKTGARQGAGYNSPVLAEGINYVDLRFQGHPRLIATAVVRGGEGVALVDPGPSSCLERLEEGLEGQGIAFRDVTHILLTHIHLDHAGATGSLVKRWPGIQVLVHERGARHMAEPSRLLKSAAQLYGSEMDRLWGEFLPVPWQNMVVVKGGEQVQAGGRRFDVAYTPGHASHHVSYFDPSSGIAFVGDTAGVCIGDFVLPPTPPPDIDIAAWKSSVDRIEHWRPDTLFLTHFGPRPGPVTHLRSLIDNLERFGGTARRLLQEDASEEERQRRFIAWVDHELLRHTSPDLAALYAAAAPLDLLWLGLARYWRKNGS